MKHGRNSLKRKLCYLLVSLMVALHLSSCNCGDQTCPALSTKEEAWLFAREGDSIRYRNDAGDRIAFGIHERKASGSTTVDCFYDGIACSCHDCPETTGSISGRTPDSSRLQTDTAGNLVYVVNNYSMSIGGYGRVSYAVLGHSNSFRRTSDSSITTFSNDSILPNFSIGSRTYQDVVVHHVDTTVNPAPQYPNSNYVYYVLSSYYNKESGIIAFYDLKTGSMFYRN